MVDQGRSSHRRVRFYFGNVMPLRACRRHKLLLFPQLFCVCFLFLLCNNDRTCFETFFADYKSQWAFWRSLSDSILKSQQTVLNKMKVRRKIKKIFNLILISSKFSSSLYYSLSPVCAWLHHQHHHRQVMQRQQSLTEVRKSPSISTQLATITNSEPAIQLRRVKLQISKRTSWPESTRTSVLKISIKFVWALSFVQFRLFWDGIFCSLFRFLWTFYYINQFLL